MHRPTLRVTTVLVTGALAVAGGTVAAVAAPSPGAGPVVRAAGVGTGGAGADVGHVAPTVTDRIIVRYRADARRSPSADLRGERRQDLQRAARSTDADVDVEHVRRTGQGAEVWSLGEALPVDEVEEIAAAVAADPAVEYAEPDRLKRPLAAAPDDPRWADQWALQATAVGVDVLGAWDATRGAGVRVAVLDTGYRPHADLTASVVGGYDMISDPAIANDGGGRDSDARDPGDWTAANECGRGEPALASSWHGTHVAGTVAAVTGNGRGVAGVAPEAKVVPLRVLGTCGGYTSDIADAMVWASGGTVSGVPANPHPARVLNLSLGGSGRCDTTSQRAIDAARANGAVVVVAAGNEGRDVSTSSPANCSGVVAVAAYGHTGARAYYSNYGTLVAVAAPGGDQRQGTSRGILSTLNSGTTTPGGDSYAYFQGTSMAAPHVAGVAALMIAADPSLTPDRVEALLRSTAQPFVASCSGCGVGMVDAAAAVAAVAGTTPGGPDEPDEPGQPTGVTESEPNDSRTSADVVDRPADVSGTMGSSSDVDWFRVSLPAGATLAATLAGASSSADYDLYVHDSSGRQVASSRLGAGRTDSVRVRNSGSSAAVVLVRVDRYSGPTGSAGGYTLGLDW